MSAYAARLKAEMRPKLDELLELNEIDNPTDEQKAAIDTLTVTLAGMKAEYDKAVERHQKSMLAESMYGGLSDPAEEPRARYDRPTTGTKQGEPEVKMLSDYLIGSRGFKHPQNGQYHVVEPVPSALLYPFLERKAAYIPGNLNLSGGNVRILSPTDPAMRYPLLDLLRTVPWNDMVVPYLPLTFTNNAAEVEYGAAKPESTNAGDIATVMMRTVATWKETPRQILRYIPALRPVIEDELRQGVLAKMQDRVMNGPGTTTVMKGILAQITQTATGTALVSQIFDAIGKVETAGGVVDAITMNPGDYAKLLQAEWATNTFNPLVQGERFGQYRIIRLSTQAAGTATVGDWSSSVVLFVGEAANVQATEALGFKTNIVTIRAEMDAVVLVERPWLMVKAAGTVPAPA